MKKLLLTLITAIFSLGLIAQTDIIPPQLNLPSDEDDDQMPNVELDWYPSGGVGAVTYEVNIDTDSLFSDPQVFTTSISAQDMSELMFGTEYFWRVRATDNTGTSDWSETWRFTTFFALDLNAPSDESTDIEPMTEIKWKVKFGAAFVTGITYYDYQIAYDTNFNDIYISGHVADGTFPDETFYVAYTQLLRFDTTYYWRVRARHTSDESDWSERWSFSTIATPINDSPANGATDQMLDAEIEWEAIEGAFEYMYELCTDPSFTIPCMTLSDTNVVEATGLMFGTTYYWRAKAMHTADTSDWSETWEFETINTVNLATPENGSYVSDIFPTLTWETLTGIAGYELMFSENGNFEDAEEVQLGASASSYLIGVLLEQDVPIYWKMRAFENGDTTNWSDTWTFILGEPDGINDVFAGGNIQIHPNPTQGDVFISATTTEATEVVVSVSNLVGQTVKEQLVTFDQGGAKFNLNLSDLNEGIYLIQLKSGRDVYTQKIIVDK